MNARLLDILYGAVFLGVTAFLYWVAVDTGVPARRVASDPMWYPKVLLALLLICSGFLVVRSVLNPSRARLKSREWLPLAVTLAVAGVFLTLFELLGFVITSFLLIPLLGWFLGFRRPLALALITTIFTGVVWCGFNYGLGITPPGASFQGIGA